MNWRRPDGRPGPSAHSMASDFDQTGVFRVNGSWATSIKYEATALGVDTDTVNLRFMQGRAEVARVATSRAELGALLGEPNRTTIERHLANDADKYLALVTGELRGKKLHFGEAMVPAAEPDQPGNLIAPTPSRERNAKAGPKMDPEASTGTSRQKASATDAPGNTNAPDGADEKRGAGKEEPDGEPRATTAPVPPHIAAKYLVKGDTYHFDDKTVAFVDKGKSLTVQTYNRAVIQDLVAIALARDWQAITVSGSEAFRREAWKAAASAGLTVTGYTPTELERLALERERSRRDTQGTDTREPPASEPTRPPPTRNDSQTAPQRHKQPAQGVRYGVLVDHGEAPYRHDPEQSASYFLTVKDAKGQERSSWGVGLKDAIETSKTAPAAGDLIGIRRAGSEPVTVVQRVVDEHGEITTQAIAAKRQTWEVEKADYFMSRTDPKSQDQPKPSKSAETSPMASTSDRTRQELGTRTLTQEQEAAAAIRSAATTREELQLKYPQLNKAVFQHLASHDQFADAYVKSGLIREADRAQVIAQMRERLASKLEQGEKLRGPDNNEVNTLIRRSVNRVAADIGRPPVDIEPRTPTAARVAMAREDVQVRG